MNNKPCSIIQVFIMTDLKQNVSNKCKSLSYYNCDLNLTTLPWHHWINIIEWFKIIQDKIIHRTKVSNKILKSYPFHNCQKLLRLLGILTLDWFLRLIMTCSRPCSSAKPSFENKKEWCSLMLHTVYSNKHKIFDNMKYDESLRQKGSISKNWPN